MDGVNKTLYISLYGKALVSRQGRILRDPAAERLWEKEGFPMKRKSRSKYLAYYMAMRAAAFDRWTLEQTKRDKSAVVLHLGCGLDDPNVPGLRCVREHSLPPNDLAEALTGTEGKIFRSLYGGSFARKLCKLYEYEG